MTITGTPTRIADRLRRECEDAIVESIVRNGRATTVQQGAALAVDIVLTTLNTALAAAPAPTAPKTHNVHNHGPEDGPGLSCSEMRLADGTLLGTCMLPEPHDWAYGVRHKKDGHVTTDMTESQSRGYANHPDIIILPGGTATHGKRIPVRRRLGAWESNPEPHAKS